MTSWLLVPVAIASAVVFAWFLTHCADPMLRYVQAPASAQRVIQVFTFAAIVGQILFAASRVLGLWLFAAYVAVVVTAVLWLLVVGVGYLTHYRWLVRGCRLVEGRSR